MWLWEELLWVIIQLMRWPWLYCAICVGLFGSVGTQNSPDWGTSRSPPSAGSAVLRESAELFVPTGGWCEFLGSEGSCAAQWAVPVRVPGWQLYPGVHARAPGAEGTSDPTAGAVGCVWWVRRVWPDSTSHRARQVGQFHPASTQWVLSWILGPCWQLHKPSFPK